MATVPNPSDAKVFLKALKPFRNWFELDITIKLFGATILHWHFPPTAVEGHSDASVEVIDVKEE